MSSLNFTIQKATWRDYSQLKDLEKQCFSKQDQWPFWDLIGILSFPGYVRLKAVFDEQMIGFIGGERANPGSIGWITTLATAPSFQRTGIATRLLEACEKELGTPTIRLTVRLFNEAAIHLYEKNGYALVDRWKKYYVGGEDGLVYEKRR
jgi:ribosomal-protein-alanine N-acetyltransferase